jgi:cyclophilin family peptidyl-prolyl cis-trans isomerase
MKLVAYIFTCLLLSFALAACNQPAGDPTDPPGATVKKGVAPQPDAEVAVIENADAAFGKIVIELYPNLAPKMVEKFKTLIKQGFYNGVAWHRVNPQSGVIQTGDPATKNDLPNGAANAAQMLTLDAEFSDIPYERGIVGAARLGGGGGLTEQEAYNTANTQFFITLKRVNAWDKRYTVFGKVIQGMNNADTLAGAPTEAGTERPAGKIAIKSVTLEPRSNYVK